MKTQLLQDFDESGSKAAADAARVAQPQQAEQSSAAPPAAVWQRRQASASPTQRSAPPAQSEQRAESGATAGATGAGQMRPPAARGWEQPTQPRQRASEGAWTGPRPVPPELRAAATDTTVRWPAHERAPGAVPPPTDPSPAEEIPGWLSERLREDAEQQAKRQRSRLMTRRALGWSAAATVAAMLAVTGYWFYQESRVEGALNVVANTSPTPAVAAPEASRQAMAPPPAPAVPPSPAAVPPSPAAPAQSSVDAAAAARTVTPVALDAAPAVKPVRDKSKPERTGTTIARLGSAQENTDLPARHRKRHTQAADPSRASTKASADSDPTPAQRREETLMQCRVLGYDARECTRRGCMMTRFGLACPG